LVEFPTRADLEGTVAQVDIIRAGVLGGQEFPRPLRSEADATNAFGDDIPFLDALILSYTCDSNNLGI